MVFRPPRARRAQRMISTETYNDNLTIQKKWGDGPQIGSLGQFSPIGQFGQKPDFQEFLSSLTKMAIARSFLDQLTTIFFADGS